MTAERERLQSQLAEVQDKLSGLEEGAELSTVKIKDLESGKAAVMQKLENTVRLEKDIHGDKGDCTSTYADRDQSATRKHYTYCYSIARGGCPARYSVADTTTESAL
jgi:hypothetical protein